MSDMPLRNRIAVVTGASAGIGQAVTRLLVDEGATVVINARRRDRLDDLVAELGTEDVAAVPGDAADERVVREMLDAARDTFGQGRREADLVVVNAGRGLRGSVYDSDPARWNEVVRTNLIGTAMLLRAAAERMVGPVEIAQGPPKPVEPPTPPKGWLDRPRDIVVLGSTVGRNLSPFSSFYGAAKAGVHMLAESLRRVIGPRGVRVTLLEPGIVRSEFQDSAGYDRESFGRFMDSIGPVLTPEDVARMVLFVVSQPAHVHVNDLMVRPTRQEYP
jgi:NADP-dependent 3-hydroxy acid dehydrogenase YdfG